MANPTNKTRTQLYTTLFLILSGIILLALIVVSAFAYQWHSENATLKQSNQTLRALNDQSTLTSITTELTDTQQSLYEAQSENEELTRIIKEYQQILTDNNLMPTAAPTAAN